jgi:fucose permease
MLTKIETRRKNAEPQRYSAAMSSLLLLALIYFAFISLGLPDGVVGVAWPAMRLSLNQPVEAAGLITMVATACSALSGFASGAVLKRFSAGPVVMVSGFMTGLALLGFSVAPSFATLLLLVVPLGFGAGAVDSAMNHFVARHYSSRHMNWLHGFWGLCATLGPALMAAALANPAQSGDGWRAGYLQIGLAQVGLAVLFLATLQLWKKAPEIALSTTLANKLTAGGVAVSAEPQKPRQLALWLAPFLFFLYAGIEVGTSLWAATVLVESRHLSPAAAGLWVSGFFGAIMGGRFATGFVSQRLGNRKLVRFGLMLAALGAVLFSLGGWNDVFSLAGLVLLGLGCAPIYPALMHEAARRFDAATTQRVIGHQVGSAYIGCVVLPAALGLIGATWGLWLIMPMIAAMALLLLWLSASLDAITEPYNLSH